MILIQIILAYAIVLVTIIQIYHKFKALRSPLGKIPGPWYAPLTTLHLRYLFSSGSIWKLVEKSHSQYGPIMRLGPRQVWISDKDAMKQILVRIDLPKVSMYAEISRDKSSPGLFGEIRPEPHKRLKRFFSPAFTVSYIDNLEEYFKSTLRDLLNKYQLKMSDNPAAASEKEFEVDLMDDLHNVALDIMGECSFGKGFGQTNPDNKTEDGIDEEIWKSIPRSIFDGLSNRYKMVYVKKLFRTFGVNLKFDWPSDIITAIETIIYRRTTSCAKKRQDLLQHLLAQARNPGTGTVMNARDISDQMSEILLAGSETTSGTIACLFLELARNPSVRKKLLESLPSQSLSDDIVSSKTVRTNPCYEYLEACIKENLRLHPIASEMGRCTGKEWVNLMGYDLPPHTVVSASYRALHQNDDFWPQAQRFWPERFLPEDKRSDAPAADMNAYYPFSGGKHSCIGINFAWAEMRVVVANILSRFDIVEVPGQDIDFRQYITMQFSTGSWRAILKPRKIESTPCRKLTPDRRQQHNEC